MKHLKRLISALLLTAVLATAVFASAATIKDVPAKNWAYPYVSKMVDMDIMQTHDGGYFYPDLPTSRGEFVLYLWRAMDAPAIGVDAGFTDVSWDDPWSGAVNWAVGAGITNGVSPTRFDPYGDLTREQAFTFTGPWTTWTCCTERGPAMEDKRQVVPGLEDNRDVTTTLGVQKAKGGLGKVMGGLGSLLVLVGFVGSNLPLIVGGIVVAVIGAVLGNHAQKVGQAAISQRLVPGALHQVFETVEYPAVQDLTRAQIAEGSPGLPRFDSLYTNDVVSASYQGLPVWLAGLKLCEMALYRDPETEMEKEEEREIFLGLWFACDLGKEIGCDCTITPKGVLGRLTGSRNALGSEVFARKFQVQTDRPDWAERLLTQPVQEAMLSLLSMGKTYLRLRPDGKLTLAVSMGKPMFYLGKGSVQAESIQRRFVEELRGPTRLVDALRRSLP